MAKAIFGYMNGPDPRAVASVAADNRRLRDRVAELEALVLRFYADLSEEETAKVMGVSRGTVKSTTHRAIAALGRLLHEPEKR